MASQATRTFDAFPPSFGFTSAEAAPFLPQTLASLKLEVCGVSPMLTFDAVNSWDGTLFVCCVGIRRTEFCGTIKKKRNDVLDCVVACAHCFGRLSFVAEG